MYTHQKVAEFFNMAVQAQQKYQWNVAIANLLQVINGLNNLNSKNFIDQLNLIMSYHFLTCFARDNGDQQYADQCEAIMLNILIDESYNNEKTISNYSAHELATTLNHLIISNSCSDQINILRLKLIAHANSCIEIACAHSLTKLFDQAERAINFANLLSDSILDHNTTEVDNEYTTIESPEMIMSYDDLCSVDDTLTGNENFCLEGYFYNGFFGGKANYSNSSHFNKVNTQMYSNEEVMDSYSSSFESPGYILS